MNALLDAVFVTTRSACAVTAVVAVEVLLPGLGSAVADETDAELASAPAALAGPAICTGALAPLASEAIVQGTTAPAAEHAQPAPFAETRVTPAGRLSTSTASCAASGPVFEIVIV